MSQNLVQYSFSTTTLLAFHLAHMKKTKVQYGNLKIKTEYLGTVSIAV